MAELAALDWRKELSYNAHRRPLDVRSLVLAVGLTALLISLLALFGPGYRDLPESVPLLAVFEVPAPVQDDVAPPPDSPDKELVSATRDRAAPQSAPQPAPLAAMTAPIVPAPEIKLSPLLVPEITLAGPTQIVTDGRDTRGNGQGGAGVGGNGKGGGGLGGDGAGGSGTRPTLTARWAPEMRLSRLNAYFPDAAGASGHGGVAVIKCLALKNHRMRDCTAVGEYPEGLGFAEAALASEPVLRVQVRDQKGKRVYDQWVLFRLDFRHPETGKRSPPK